MTDVPVPVAKQPDTPTRSPPSRLDAVKGFIGDMARPFAIYVTSLGAAIATVRIATAVTGDKLDFSAAAIFIGAVYSGVAVLYGAKAWENAQTAKTTANVQIAQSVGPTQ